ncbi:MAG: YhcH/YjgK/YiaL family protein [Bacteroidales bacterium]|nr:YhcH/YjgK/YiaL family protein [Bacteroidales bacterium]
MKIRTIIMSIASIVALFSCGQKKESASDIAAKLLKDNGIDVPFHPSVDFDELLRQYKANPELWDAAFACLAENAPKIHDLTEFGTTELVGKRCYAMINELEPKPFEETKLEGHRKYIDVQLTEGPVRWGICPADSKNQEILEEYDPGKDIGFCLSDDTVYYIQPADQPSIFVFFPKNLHNPSFAPDGVRYEKPLHKIVIKVENAE